MQLYGYQFTYPIQQYKNNLAYILNAIYTRLYSTIIMIFDIDRVVYGNHFGCLLSLTIVVRWRTVSTNRFANYCCEYR